MSVRVLLTRRMALTTKTTLLRAPTRAVGQDSPLDPRQVASAQGVLRLRLAAIARRGERATLVMFGSSGSGKTFSLEGGRCQDGIVKMILDRLCSAGDGNGGAVAVRLCEVRRGGTAERDLGPPTEFTDSGACAPVVPLGVCANRVSAVRLAPTTGAHEGASSRSWTRLELVSVLARSSPSLNPPQTSVRSGGKPCLSTVCPHGGAVGGTAGPRSLADVPGREMNEQPDSKYVNAMYVSGSVSWPAEPADSGLGATSWPTA